MEAIRPKLVALATVWLLAATGCHHLPASWYYAWHGYPDQGVETPFVRAQGYRELAVTAAKQSPAEQEQTSQVLSQAFASEEDFVVRAEITRALGVCRTATAAATLQRALADSQEHVRRAACFAWGHRGGPDAVQNLTTLLRTEKNTDVRLAAIRALGEMKDPSTVPTLALALEDSNVAIQNSAMASLENTTGRYYGADVNAWRAFAQGQQVTPKDHSVADRVHDYIYR